MTTEVSSDKIALKISCEYFNDEFVSCEISNWKNCKKIDEIRLVYNAKTGQVLFAIKGVSGFTSSAQIYRTIKTVLK